MCYNIYELDPTHFLSAYGLAWESPLKKIETKVELSTNNGILLLVEKGIWGGICHALHRYAKANNKHMKNYDKNKESSYLIYLDANNFYGWAMTQKLSVDGLKQKKSILKFNEDFIKNYNEESNKGYILEVYLEYPKEIVFTKFKELPFLPEKIKR